ncbi:NUDIX hydrolase [Roseospirillum parvum]|uniref:NUDIX hydrolase n=1 Tax=Roseospirillum parvum TaxID=83401 RepID=UPI000B88ABDE|nr:NUDIX hydrolase [Roseospirillum parvum]
MTEPPPEPPPEPQRFKRRIPEGDDRERAVCQRCGFIAYDNPRLIVGAVCLWEDRILLARRAIAPRQGFWTVPAGFMENGETPAQGAAREVREEALAEVEIGPLIGLYPLAPIDQVHMIYRARMTSPRHAPGPESLETALVAWADIPWDELAFPSIHWALGDHARTAGSTAFQPGTTPPDWVPTPLR